MIVSVLLTISFHTRDTLSPFVFSVTFCQKKARKKKGTHMPVRPEILPTSCNAQPIHRVDREVISDLSQAL